MEIKLNIKDCKVIADNITKKNTEIEQCLARKMLACEHENSKLKEENNMLFDTIFSIYNTIASSKIYDRLVDKRKKNLEALSKAKFAEAVNLNAESKKKE